MKDAIKEYLHLTEKDKKELWENAVFVFDTNIFLNLYRYTQVTRDSLLEAMNLLSDRIWMPKQVAQELMKDRAKVIFDTLKIFDELKTEKNKFIENCKEKLRRENTDVKIDVMSKEIDKHIEILAKESNYIENVEDDIILNQLLKLYDNKVGNGFSASEIEDIKKEGAERYSKQIPPGFKDFKKGEENNAFGDLIIWKEILLYSKNNKKDIIYVTGDKKEDWWEKACGRTLGPRVELKKEFFEETKQDFYMYSMDRFLVQFKDMQGTQINQSAIDEVKNYERIIEETRRRLMYEHIRSRETAKLNEQNEYLLLLLQSLSENEKSLENRISELKHIISNKERQSFEEEEDNDELNNLLKELKSKNIYMDEILRKKENIKKEIKKLTWKKNRISNSLPERREREIDQL